MRYSPAVEMIRRAERAARLLEAGFDVSQARWLIGELLGGEHVGGRWRPTANAAKTNAPKASKRGSTVTMRRGAKSVAKLRPAKAAKRAPAKKAASPAPKLNTPAKAENRLVNATYRDEVPDILAGLDARELREVARRRAIKVRGASSEDQLRELIAEQSGLPVAARSPHRPNAHAAAARKETGGIRRRTTQRSLYRVDDPPTQLRARVSHFETLEPRAVLAGSQLLPPGSGAGWTRTHVNIEHRDPVDRRWSDAGYLIVDVSPDGRSVWHSLKIDEEFQDQGFVTRYLGRTFEEYKRLGVERVLLETGDVGGYAWARAGFRFADPTARRELVKSIRSQLTLYGRPYRWDKSVFDEFDRVLADQNFEPIDLAMVGRKPGEKNWPGKDILLGAQWRGVMDL